MIRESVAMIQRLQRAQAMNLPFIDDNYGDLPDLCDITHEDMKVDLPLPADPTVSPTPQDQEKGQATVLIGGLSVAAHHPSGVGFEAETGAIYGATISNMLGLRVLRAYLHPEAVRERALERKAHPEQAWKDLSPLDKSRLVGWQACGFCWEANWCVVNHFDETPRHADDIICENCFFEHVGKATTTAS
jgi:hypothetical protein